MKMTSAKTIRDTILGKRGIANTLVSDPKCYTYGYKTKGGHYYMWMSATGERVRISEKEYYGMTK